MIKKVNLCSKQAGFNLLELMVALVILAILAAIGLPSFNEMISDNRMLSETQSVSNGIKIARSEAIKRGEPITICGSSNGKACNSNDLNAGWIIFIDSQTPGVVDNSKHFTQGGNIIMYHKQEAGGKVKSTLDDQTNPYIQFNPQGGLSY